MALGPRVRRRYTLLRLRGNTVSCPCCDGSFSAFTAHPTRPIRVCPRCGSHDRHRTLWRYLVQRTPLLREPLSVLHLAPDRAIARKLQAAPKLRYLSADADSPEAMVHFDLADIPYPDGAFDVILCSHVLEHVADDRGAMRELMRVMAPGGFAIVMVPTDPGRSDTYEDPAIVTPQEREQAYAEADALRLYGADFPSLLEEAGFVVTVDTWTSTLDEGVVERFGLAREDLYVCRAAPPAWPPLAAQ